MLIELALRAFSFAFQNAQPDAGGAFRVVCVGASHTQGLGAKTGKSYCDQLQERLSAAGVADAKTFNLGVGGMNSHQILTRMPELLKKYRPHIVVGMIGEPNAWNFQGLDQFLSKESKGARPAALSSLLRDLRILRALRLFGDVRDGSELDPSESELSKLLPMTEPKNSPSRAAALENIFRKTEGRGPRAVTAATQLALLAHYSSQDNSRALAWAKAGVEAQPGQFNLSLLRAIETISADRLTPPLASGREELVRKLRASLSQEKLPALATRALMEGDSRGAVSQCFREAPCRPYLVRVAELDPENTWLRSVISTKLFASADYDSLTRLAAAWLRWNPVYFYEAPISQASRLRSEMERIGGQRKNLATLQQAIESSGREFPFILARLGRTTDGAMISRWLAHDLAEFQKLLDREGITVIFQTLPPHRRAGLPRRSTDEITLEFCRQANCHLSDTWQAFQHLAGKIVSEDQGEVFSRSFGPSDEHLNEFGHSLVADRLMKDLLPVLNKTNARTIH